MIDVVTFYSPRPGSKHFKTDYGKLIKWQKATAEKFGHRHVLISDRVMFKGMNMFITTVPLPDSLMKAILTAQIDYLENGWTGENPVLLADIDCLIARRLDTAFDGGFDLGLTSRPHETSRINNGAMYIGPGNKAAVVAFFKRALAICQDHWGGDQEAISQVAEPVFNGHGQGQTVERENGLRLRFLPMLTYNVAAVMEGVRHVNGDPYVVHFKGLVSKPWMKTYANLFILRIKT